MKGPIEYKDSFFVGGRTVLFVDDDELMLKSIERTLHNEPYNTLFADSGKEVLEILQREDIHVIVTDMCMPEMGGLELLGAIKNDYPHIIRMVLSGDTGKATLLDAINQGEIFRFIPKPWKSNEEFRTIIRQAIQYYDLRDERDRLIEELKDAHDQLEEKVARRTRSLSIANEQLTSEIARHKKTEEALILSRELAEAANIAKSQFLTNMSHEIRTPMNAIIGFSDLLADEDLPSEQKQKVNLIRKAGRNLLNIIDDILDFSKIEAGKLEVKPVDCLLKKILDAVDAIMRPLAVKKDLQFEIIYSETLPVIILTDDGRLHQCLVNLISNAIKFTEKGHVHVKVFIDNQGTESFIRFDVEDTGIGIPPDMQEHVFESFGQVEKGSTRQYGGTGIGLTITNQLAGLLGGKVSLTSRLGAGSIFSLTIPAGVNLTSKPSLEKDKAVCNTIPMEDNFHTYSGKVLIADDDKDCHILVTELFEKLGLEITIAADGKEAIEKTLEGPFDLIFIDIRMPHLDGLEATEVLREKGITIPIIALTAHAMEGDRELCLQAGCDDYLSKPIDREELLQILDKYLTVGSEKKHCRPKRYKVVQS